MDKNSFRVPRTKAMSFMTDYKTAWLNAQKFFSILKKEERFTISELENGTHVVRLDIKGKNINRFRDSLAKKIFNYMSLWKMDSF